MKKTLKTIRFAMVLMTALMGFACSEQNLPEGDALLWKVTGKEAQPSYVLATCSAVDTTFLDSIPGLTEALGKVKKVLMPYDASALYSLYAKSSLDKPKEDKEVEDGFLMPPDTTYAQLLSKEDLQQLDSLLCFIFPDDENRQKQYTYKPLRLLASVRLCKKLNRDKAQVSTPSPVKREGRMFLEIMLKDFATNRGLDVDYVWTAQEVLDMQNEWNSDVNVMISHLPLKVQAEELHNALVSADDCDARQQERIEQAVANYKTLSLAKAGTIELDKGWFSEEEQERLKKNFMSYFLNNRIPTFEAAMSQQPTLVTMEANGLLGAEGLLARLCAAGYKVEPVTE